MAERDWLEGLRPMAEEAFSGLHADEALRRRVLRAAKEPASGRRRRPDYRLVPAVCAALLLAVGLVAFRARKPVGPSFTEAQSRDAAANRAAVPVATGTPAAAGMPLAARAADEETGMVFAAAGEDWEE